MTFLLSSSLFSTGSLNPFQQSTLGNSDGIFSSQEFKGSYNTEASIVPQQMIALPCVSRSTSRMAGGRFSSALELWAIRLASP